MPSPAPKKRCYAGPNMMQPRCKIAASPLIAASIFRHEFVMVSNVLAQMNFNPCCQYKLPPALGGFIVNALPQRNCILGASVVSIGSNITSKRKRAKFEAHKECGIVAPCVAICCREGVSVAREILIETPNHSGARLDPDVRDDVRTHPTRNCSAFCSVRFLTITMAISIACS